MIIISWTDLLNIVYKNRPKTITEEGLAIKKDYKREKNIKFDYKKNEIFLKSLETTIWVCEFYYISFITIE